MRQQRPKPGDVVLAQENDKRKIVGHYLADVEGTGPYVQFFECQRDWDIEDGLTRCRALFPPVFCGVWAAVRTGAWRRLGTIPLPQHIQFRYLEGGIGRKGDEPRWWLNDNGKEVFLDSDVPEPMRELELNVVWSAELLEDRFNMGHNPFGYEAIMKRYRENRPDQG